MSSPPENFAEELDNGNLEYKLKLTNIDEEKLEKRITQMKFRLREGNGECRYFIGVEDSGNPLGISENEMKASVDTIKRMTDKIKAQITQIDYLKGKEGVIAQITIRQENSDKKIMEIKIGLLGEENSGKSTLVGCLISDKRDNGNGLTRTNVFRHRHEINCGKTSSFTHQILGYDKDGNKTNVSTFGTLSSWPQIVERSVKVINFIDMGCSESSLNNSMKALSPNYLDYIALVLSCEKGVNENTVKFLKIALSLKIPVITIITKSDLVSDEDLRDVLINFRESLKKEKSGKNPLVAKDKEDVLTFVNNITEGIMPIFVLSNKTGTGLDYFNNFLSILPLQPEQEEVKDDLANVQFDFLEIIHKEDSQKNSNKKANYIIEGIVTKGTLLAGDECKIGPFNNEKARYAKGNILTIHCKKMVVPCATKGQFCSIEVELEPVKEHIRTGMVLIGSESKEVSVRKFKAELWSMDSKEIKLNWTYQPLVHIGHVCQCAKIVRGNSTEEELSIPQGKSVKVDFEFIYYPENISPCSFLIIIDGDVRIYGNIIEVAE